ncbi:Polysaccharide biosynthesis protein [compost metagenome]
MSLKREALFHICGSIAYALAQWSVLVLLSRLISIEAAGEYAYYLALFTPAAILTTFGIRNSVASDREREHSLSSYRRAQHAGLLLLSAYYLVILLATDGDAAIASLVFLIKLADNLSELSYGTWVRTGGLHRYGISKIAKLALFAALFLALLALGIRDRAMLFAYPAATLIVYFLYDRRQEEVEDPRDTGLLNIIRTGTPLALGSFVVSLNSSIPRISINHILDEQALAEFVMLTYFIAFATLPITSLCQAIIPRITMQGAPKRVWWFLIAYSSGYLAFMMLLANPLIDFIYKTRIEYPYHVLAMIGIAGGLHFMSTLSNAVLVANRQFQQILVAALLSTLAALIASPLLIMQFAQTGAAAAYLASSLTLFIFNALYASRQQRKPSAPLDSPA